MIDLFGFLTAAGHRIDVEGGAKLQAENLGT